MAVFVVKEHAQQYKDRFPTAVNTIHHSTLIDDVLDSVDSVEEAREVLLQVRDIFQEAGMRMTKFHSSHPAVLRAVNEEDWAEVLLDVAEACAKESPAPPLKTLGMQYDPRTDDFCISAPWIGEPVWPKRKMLKTFPQLWDPLGLFLPYTVQASSGLPQESGMTGGGG